MSFLNLIKGIVITYILVANSLSVYAQKLDHIPGEFIVQVEKDKDVNGLRSRLKIADTRFAAFTSRKLMAEPLNLWLISIDFGTVNETSFEKSLKASPGIKDVRKNRLISPRVIPDDPDFTRQWQYLNTGSTGGIAGADNDMDLAWDITTGGLTPAGDTIVICVIDDGINAQHEDIKDNLWFNHKEIPGNGKDDDGNGYVDDIRGWNVEHLTDNVYEGGSHGTPVAGIVGAKGNNGKGVSGVNWNVKLMIVNYWSPNEANALAAYGYPYKMRKLYNETNGQKGAFVVATNASWGVDNTQAIDAPLWCALYDSLGQVGILNCGATTNSNTDVDIMGDLPTSCESEYLISVTNMNKFDEKLSNAGYGRRSIDLGSYGHQTFTVTRTTYGIFGGTSGATPHVTGVIGLIYAAPCMEFINISKQDPAKAALIAKDMILHGVLPNNSLKDITTTGGKLNAFRTLSNIMKLCENCSVPAGIAISMTDNAMKIDWASNSGASVVSARYRKPDDNTWIPVGNIVKGGWITGLDFCTDYEVQLGSDCGLIPGEYSYSKYVKTNGCCPIPVIDVVASTLSTIGISWLDIPNSSFLVQYQTGNNIWLEDTVSNSNFLLENLLACTGYSIRIQTKCDTHGNVSDFTKEYDISTTCGSCTNNNYCGFGKKDASQEWIDIFKLGTIQNQSGSSEVGYKNFAGLHSTDLIKDQTYGFEIIPAYAGNVFVEYYKIFIDWNQDGLWSEDEKVFDTPNALSDTIRDEITIPESALEGWTKLRIIMTFDDFEGGCDDVEFEFGEVEDYCVRIVNNTCINEATLQVIDIEKNKVVLVTDYHANEKDSVYFNFRERGNPDWTQVIAFDTFTIAGLKECTVYEYQYRSQCKNLFSNISPTDSLKTACGNFVTDKDNIHFNINPNPCYDYLTFYPGTLYDQISYFKILDLSGNEILSLTSGDAVKTEIDMSSCKNGLYLLEINTISGHRYYQKVVKMQ
ncbi:MAG: S8 family serine peptidase [Saprospiraceae bacterium]|nr:S8 family serine peptidase [Saprospiraceae bacterium]